MRHIILILTIVGAVCSCAHTFPGSDATSVVSEAADSNVLVDGTYDITICDGDCKTDSKALKGILVLDRTRASFSHESEAMQYLMRADSQKFIPNYCYYFDPATSNTAGTTLEGDIVSFGELGQDPTGKTVLAFVIDSPDFRYFSRIEPVGPTSFKGNWSSWYAPDGQREDNFPRAHLSAERISPPNAGVCFDAVRRYERTSLKAYCAEFPAKTCEPGDKDGP